MNKTEKEVSGSWKKHINFKFIAGEDLSDKPMTLTVKKILKEEAFNPKNMKNEMVMVLYFNEIPKGIIINNKVNARTIEKILGTDQVHLWVGKQITFYGKPDKRHGMVVRVKEDFSNVKM